MIQITCTGCHKQFEVAESVRKYCSHPCFIKYRKYKGFQKGSANPSCDPVRREQIRLEKLGKKPTKAQKKKISQSMKKALEDPAIREKWRLAQLGRKHSEISKENMSKAQLKRFPKTVKRLKPKLDKVFSQYIRKRDSIDDDGYRYGSCITCETKVVAFRNTNGFGTLNTNGSVGQAGHFISRRYNSTRFDERNVHLQCAKCNLWGAGEQYKYSLAIDKLYGQGTSQALHDKAMQVKKFTADELDELLTEYKIKFNDLP